MNVFGELVLDLIGTGFIGGFFLASVLWSCLWLLVKMDRDEREKRK